jgi:hypothetical protein
MGKTGENWNLKSGWENMGKSSMVFDSRRVRVGFIPWEGAKEWLGYPSIPGKRSQLELLDSFPTTS